MPRTRSRSTQITIEETIEVPAAGIKKTTKKTTKRTVSSKEPKLYLEDVLSHIEVPPDLALPSSFVAFHEPEFIKGVEHVLKRDRSLYPIVVYRNFETYQREKGVPKSDEETILAYWYSLICSVLGQQITGKAAKAVEARFRKLFKDDTPTPEETALKTTEELRGAGLSGQKAKYVVHISETFLNKESPLAKVAFYNESTSEEILDELVKLKGIGVWSAKMFATFTLKNMNLFAHDDLGVARGVSKYLQRRPEVYRDLKKEVEAIEELKELLKRKSLFVKSGSKRDWVPCHDVYVKFLGLKFAPYLLILMMLMWRLAATNVEILETTGEHRRSK